MKHVDMDEIYRKVPQEEIPWNIKEPPTALVQLVKAGKVRPCRTIDLGCGTGNHSIYLAGRGFDVTGVDISATAIKIAEQNAREKSVSCNFVVADVLGDLKEVTGTFDFAYDWELLHHIFPEDRKKYLKNVCAKLKTGSRYLSLCFSERDPQFGGTGKYRKTPLGTLLYFSSEDEIRELFEPYFHIEELSTVEIRGKNAPHPSVYAFMQMR